MADCAGRALNSRFHRFISRLGRNKFPVRRQREFSHKSMILLPIFGANRARYRRNRKIPGYFPGSREFADAEAGPLRHSGDIRCPLRFGRFSPQPAGARAG